ncbi:MAG: TonB-dependent receptor, partial [Bacteroidales bacterium]|nr:TonB-dependent receptor [Bacteroidales bacterium]
INYVFTFPKINGRISGYYTEYLNKSQKISYYNDAYGTFVHHSISNANQRNYGVEAGVKYSVWKGLSLSLAGMWSKFTYTNVPDGTIRYENNKADDVNGKVAIEGFHVGGSPEIVGTFGVQYFWRYWWFEVNVNGIANNYLDPSYIQRSTNVLPDGQTENIKEKVYTAALDYFSKPVGEGGLGFDEATAEYLAVKTVQDYTGQVRLDDWSNIKNLPITMDISVSKMIYLKGGKQLNIQLSVTNVLNNKRVKTGGYEQGRIPYYRDDFDVANVNKFPAKYYYMQGLNVFLNVGFRF